MDEDARRTRLSEVVNARLNEGWRLERFHLDGLTASMTRPWRQTLALHVDETGRIEEFQRRRGLLTG